MATSAAFNLQSPHQRGPWIRCAAPHAANSRRAAACGRVAAAAVQPASREAAGAAAATQAPHDEEHTTHATAAAAAAAADRPAAAVAAVAAVLLLGAAGPALALEIHAEPSNALSLPTWAVHTSSVLEWVTAMGLMWRYGEVSGNPRWKGMAWGMVPCLGSAMCACTWHFFYNSPDLQLQFLVALQAALTVVGNFTCWWAAYRIYQWAQEQPPQEGA